MQEILGAAPQARTVRMWEAKYPVPSAPRRRPAARSAHRAGRRRRRTPGPHHAGVGDDARGRRRAARPSASSSRTRRSSRTRSPRRSTCPLHALRRRERPRRAFAWHRKILQLLQSTGRPHHWLLKGPTHLPVLPALFDAYPDARLALMLRDPVKSATSVVDVSGVLFHMRSDDTTLGKGLGAPSTASRVTRRCRT